MKTVFECDLHTHTTRSDGHDTPRGLIDKAVKRGIKVLAMTDHDVIPVIELSGHPEGDLIEYSKKRGLIFIPGIEVSCDTLNEDVHLVCLGCNWKYEYFGKLEQTVKLSKLKSYQELVDRLQDNGVNVTWEEVLEKTGNKNAPDCIQKKQIFEVLAEKGFAKDWSEAKKAIQVSPIFNIKREKPNPKEVIQEVHMSGGIVILAHPYLIKDMVEVGENLITRDQYIKQLIEAGLDGIEASYTYDKTSYKGEMTKQEITQEIIRLYGNQVKIISGGSDYHGDLAGGKGKVRQLGEAGITYEYFSSNDYLSRIAAKM